MNERGIGWPHCDIASRLTANGSDGTLRWDVVERVVELAGPTGRKQWPVSGERAGTYLRQMKTFMDAVAGKASEPLATLGEAMRVLKIEDRRRGRAR